MKVRNLLIASLAVLGLVAFTAGQAGAVLVGINVEVFKNGISQGTALGGASTSTNTPLVVTAAVGDTLRFVVMLNQDPLNNTQSFATNITGELNNSAGGGGDLRYVAGSGTMLGGYVFPAGGGNPNSSLNDTTPANGNSNSTSLSVNSVNLYRVDYIVQTGADTDSLRDINFVLNNGYVSNPAGDLTDAATDSASVRVDLIVPEPATLLLLGSGLAGLAGFGRRKFRK